jgi:hypothetical protein
MPYYPDGTKISQLEWARLIGTISSNYSVLKIGTKVYAESAFSGGIDYSGTAGTEDAVTIQKAIDGLTVGRTAPEKVSLKGSFTLEDTLSVPGYTVLDLTQAKLTAKAALNDNMIECTGWNFSILGGVLDGNKALQASGNIIRLLPGSQRFWVRNQYIMNAKEYGIYALGVAGGISTTEVGVGVFDGITIEACGKTGFVLSTYTADHLVTNCNSGGNTEKGFAFYSTGSNIVSNCLAWNNFQSGFDISDANSSQFIALRADWNYWYGIYLTTIHDIILNEAIVHYNSSDSGNTFSGVKLNDCTYSIITNIRSMDSGLQQKYGLELAGTTDYCTVKNNTCVGNITGPYSVVGSHNSYDGIARTAVSADLSGAAATLVCLHAEQNLHLARAILLYTEASSADAGVTVEIGKESDRDYYYTGASETNKALWYTKEVTLLKNDVATGDTITFYSPGSKTGTGEVMLTIEYLTGAN